jgi:hypothetical protein
MTQIHLTAKDFSEVLCKELLDKYGTIEAAAKAVSHSCSSERYHNRPVTWHTTRKWLQAGLSTVDGHPTRSAGGRILDAAVVTKAVVGTYQVVTKGPDGTSQVHTLNKSSVSVAPVRNQVEFPVVQAASPTVIVYNRAPYVSRPITYSVVVSDVQYGFLRDQETGELDAIHDPTALAVAKQITADVRPNELYFIGDFVDWPTFSRWQQYPEYHGVMQPTIDGAHTELGEFIAAAGHQCERRVMVGSNHQQRPEKFILENNMDALNVRRANTPPTGWPVFSEQYLLRYDDLRIEFSGQYPAGEYWVNDGLVLVHAPAKKLEFHADVIHGHLHRRTITTWAQHTFSGRKNFYMYDCGCLCQLGTTDNKQRLMVTKTPSDRARTDWAHGIAVISQLSGKFPKHTVDLIEINQGTTIYQGQVYGDV